MMEEKTMTTKGAELILEFRNLLHKIENHCEELVNTRTDGKCKCVDCAFSRYYNYLNSGCLLQELKDNDVETTLEYTMKYHGIK